jgi:uncharacterized protein (DUF58 family)
MQGYFIFIFIVLILAAAGEVTRKKALERLEIKRECSKYILNPGEEFQMTTIVENKKWLPVSFLYIEEQMPVEIQRETSEIHESRGSYRFYINSYSVSWYERIIRTYRAKINRRGVFMMRHMNISVGDVFGFSYESSLREDVKELVVYPLIKPLKSILVKNNSIQGESIIKRWIYKDPLYIKGIREYNIEDRMKDIHWKSSLRMSKLMVKDYDYTSERELMIIVNVQAGDPYWSYVDNKSTERNVEITASLAHQAIGDGVPVGLWTNAQVIDYKGDFKNEIKPSMNSLKGIMELCARIDRTCRFELPKYINQKAKEFNKNTIYVFITSFLNEESIAIIQKLKRMGFVIKLIDTSENGNLPAFDGIEKLNYRGDV